MQNLALGWVVAVSIYATCLPTALAAQEGAFAPSDAAYVVYPGDQIEIYVWGEERLQRNVTVLPDGTIAIPLVGQVNAGSLTLAEIEQVVTEKLRPEYRGEVPRVTVSVVSSAGTQFSVMGRVNAPGTFTPTRRLNILEALAMAGGPSEFANLDDILVLRKEGDDLVPLKVDVSRLFRSGVRASDVQAADILSIQPGDTIIIP